MTRYVVFLLALATGCSSWTAIEKETPEQYIARTRPGHVRLSVGDSTIVLSRPLVQGDSIVGSVIVPSTEKQVAVDAPGVRKLEVPANTALPWIFLGAGVVVLLLHLYHSLDNLY